MSTVATETDEFNCRDCGQLVTWRTAKSGKRYLAEKYEWTGDMYGTQRSYWPSHRCVPNPAWIERTNAERAVAEEAHAAKQSAAAAGVTAPTGRVREVRGTVIKIKRHASAYGVAWKLTVQTDDGWQAWLSTPQALLDWAPYAKFTDEKTPTLNIGDRIVFTATVMPSDTDPLFGFAKRPVIHTTEESQ